MFGSHAPTHHQGAWVSLSLSLLRHFTNLLFQRGALDLAGAARIVLRDWSTGKIVWYAPPPPPPPLLAPEAGSTTAGSGRQALFEHLYSHDDQILSLLPTRKEMRRSGMGLVRFAPSSSAVVDERELELERPWLAEGRSDDGETDDDADTDAGKVDEIEPADDGESSENDDDDDDGEDDDDDDESAWEDDNDDEGDEETPPPVLPGKQKRKRGLVDVPRSSPAKKVAFERNVVDSRPQKKGSGVVPTRSKPPLPARAPPATAKKTAANIPTKSKLPPSSSDKHAIQDAYDFAQFFGGGRIP